MRFILAALLAVTALQSDTSPAVMYVDRPAFAGSPTGISLQVVHIKESATTCILAYKPVFPLAGKPFEEFTGSMSCVPRP